MDIEEQMIDIRNKAGQAFALATLAAGIPVLEYLHARDNLYDAPDLHVHGELPDPSPVPSYGPVMGVSGMTGSALASSGSPGWPTARTPTDGPTGANLRSESTATLPIQIADIESTDLYGV
jgi:hypothetical protein